MNYLLLKHIHIACVIVSGSAFLARGVATLRQSPWLARPLIRVLPHVVDTLLLASALAMAVLSSQYPFVNSWLTAKLVGLLLYIGCGTMALKRARSQAGRVFFLLAAVSLFAYIVSVAVTHNPLGMLASILP